MKKEYIKPQINTYIIKAQNLLVQVSNDTTDEQYAKPANLYNPFGNIDVEQ